MEDALFTHGAAFTNLTCLVVELRCVSISFPNGAVIVPLVTLFIEDIRVPKLLIGMPIAFSLVLPNHYCRDSLR